MFEIPLPRSVLECEILRLFDFTTVLLTLGGGGDIQNFAGKPFWKMTAGQIQKEMGG